MHRAQAFVPWVQAFAAFIPDGLTEAGALRHCRQLFSVAKRWENESADAFRIVRTVADLADCQTACHALLTGENVGALGDVAYLDYLYTQGLRAATLTWNGDNPWGCGCFGSGGGLTDRGFTAAWRMQSLGITVDVSHLGEQGFWQIAKRCHTPFIASHSNAAAVTPHPRNLTDEQFCAVRDCGGVVGLNLYHAHLGIPFDGEYCEAFYRHLTHFLSLDGEDTICIGTDFDGMSLPPSYDGMHVLPKLYTYLLSRGLSAALLDKVFYSNAFGFFTKALA